MKVGLHFYLTAAVLTKILQKCSLSSPLPNIWILSKPLNLIGRHGNQNAKFVEIKSKPISSETISGMKLEHCRNVHNISLYKIMLLLLLLICFDCYGNSINLQWEKWKWNLSFIAIFLRYFDKSFTEFLCSWSSPLLTLSILSKLVNLMGCHGNRKAKFAKKFWKIINSDAIREMKLKLRRNVHNISLYKILFFIVVVHLFSLLRQIKVSIDL